MSTNFRWTQGNGGSWVKRMVRNKTSCWIRRKGPGECARFFPCLSLAGYCLLNWGPGWLACSRFVLWNQASNLGRVPDQGGNGAGWHTWSQVLGLGSS
ncbi:hypothetical protein AFLA_001368 [Aspergillus flavus NRRL3357]|nr:hypothetical protein AFLA_001368 [Aspergillus flavus NRRL3357]